MKNPGNVDFTRELRHKPTDAETQLWLKLREINLEGTKFRRQHPFGKYIVDFVSLPKKLIIEVDGSQHIEKKNFEHDAKRTMWLEGQGFRVLRFWDNDVLQNTDTVVSKIFESIKDCDPYPNPLP
jgi:very-short-patch-repair endonuclease